MEERPGASLAGKLSGMHGEFNSRGWLPRLHFAP
jgi:hypothetical protein